MINVQCGLSRIITIIKEQLLVNAHLLTPNRLAKWQICNVFTVIYKKIKKRCLFQDNFITYNYVSFKCINNIVIF